MNYIIYKGGGVYIHVCERRYTHLMIMSSNVQYQVYPVDYLCIKDSYLTRCKAADTTLYHQGDDMVYLHEDNH